MATKKTLKSLPNFKTESKESDFWRKNDSTDYIDWSKAQVATFPDLKPSTETISLRLPKHLLEEIKNKANKLDVPYQSLIKIFLSEKVAEELPSYGLPPKKIKLEKKKHIAPKA